MIVQKIPSYSIIACCLVITISLSTLNADSTSNQLVCNSDDNEESCKATMQTQHDECQIYLAESSIPNAGLGIYTTSEIKKNAIVGSEVSIPLTDMNKTILDDYYWDSFYRGHFLEAYQSSTIIPGLGMAANSARGYLSNMNLSNVNIDSVALNEDDKFLSVDISEPEVGSYSDYTLHQWIATGDIPMGMELFAEYGDRYFIDRLPFETIPLSTSYQEADKIIRDFLTYLQGRPHFTQSEKQNLWTEKRNSVEIRTSNALPSEVDVLAEVSKKGGAALFALPNVIRPIEWLRENGQCMDNLIPKKSTIPHAGRGAFAKRFISKNTLVAPAPLLHFNDSNVFEMQDVEYDPIISSFTKKKYSDAAPKQLFMNYCLGNPDSSLLLFPYSSTTQLINHDKKQVNSELRWSTSNLHQSHWLTQSLSDLPAKAGLMMDIIATRDIRPGEEIFLNYGDEWEDAYIKHGKEWQQPSDTETYTHPETMNKDSSTNILRTVLEQRTNPYPPNVQTVCYYQHEEGKEQSVYENTIELNYHYHQQVHPGKSFLLPCDVLERSMISSTTRDEMYHVRIFPFNGSPSSLVYPIVVRDITRNQILFMPSPYTTNMFVKNAFRHFIGVPNDIFPESWKNLKGL